MHLSKKETKILDRIFGDAEEYIHNKIENMPDLIIRKNIIAFGIYLKGINEELRKQPKSIQEQLMLITCNIMRLIIAEKEEKV